MSATEKKSKGGARPGAGRKKGVPNRRSWHARLELEALGFEPLAEMVAIIQATDDPDKKWGRLYSLMQFVYPRLTDVTELPAPPADEDDGETPASKRDTDALLKLAEGSAK